MWDLRTAPRSACVIACKGQLFKFVVLRLLTHANLCQPAHAAYRPTANCDDSNHSNRYNHRNYLPYNHHDHDHDHDQHHDHDHDHQFDKGNVSLVFNLVVAAVGVASQSHIV